MQRQKIIIGNTGLRTAVTPEVELRGTLRQKKGFHALRWEYQRTYNAIAMGCMSYLFILCGGIAANKMKGMANTLKDFSLPISMSFRLFGAMLSGLLVTELVYYAQALSIVLPVIVGVLFTLLHAVIQAYVLITLTSLFYGEVTEPHAKKARKAKNKKQ